MTDPVRRDVNPPPRPPGHDADHEHGSGPTGTGVLKSSDGSIRILMLSANPRTTSRSALDEQARTINEKLRLAQDRDGFELITCWAVRPDDLLQHLNQYRPQIVHFSGHGDDTGEITLSNETGGEHRVSTQALAELFRSMKDDIRIVVLNAGYSTIQAQAISAHIDYVVGMRAPIDDHAATVFAAAFYSALGFRRTVEQAFDQATIALMLNGLPDHATPELIVRPGTELNGLRAATVPSTSSTGVEEARASDAEAAYRRLAVANPDVREPDRASALTASIPATVPKPANMPQAPASTPRADHSAGPLPSVGMTEMRDFAYSVDLVLVIDATKSMAPVIKTLKSNAMALYDDLDRIMNEVGKKIDSLRVRVVAYRDFYADSPQDSLIASDFFRLPDQRRDFADFVHDIRATGGGDEPETGLEALAEAIQSPWSKDSAKRRQVIVLWTDASAHPLERNREAKPVGYPAHIPGDLDELTDMWDGQSSPVHPSWKRLLLYAPNVYPWTDIANNWEQTLHYATRARAGLGDRDYMKVLDSIARSV